MEFESPSSTEDAEGRLSNLSRRIVEMEQALSVRKLEIPHEGPMPDDLRDWFHRTKRALSITISERTFVKRWLHLRHTVTPEGSFLRVGSGCVSCSADLPDDDAYARGWCRIRGSVNGQSFECWICPNENTDLRADIIARMVAVGDMKDESDQHHASGDHGRVQRRDLRNRSENQRTEKQRRSTHRDNRRPEPGRQ
jgi:hypothetical protein